METSSDDGPLRVVALLRISDYHVMWMSRAAALWSDHVVYVHQGELLEPPTLPVTANLAGREVQVFSVDVRNFPLEKAAELVFREGGAPAVFSDAPLIEFMLGGVRSIVSLKIPFVLYLRVTQSLRDYDLTLARDSGFAVLLIGCDAEDQRNIMAVAHLYAILNRAPVIVFYKANETKDSYHQMQDDFQAAYCEYFADILESWVKSMKFDACRRDLDSVRSLCSEAFGSFIPAVKSLARGSNVLALHACEAGDYPELASRGLVVFYVLRPWPGNLCDLIPEAFTEISLVSDEKEEVLHPFYLDIVSSFEKSLQIKFFHRSPIPESLGLRLALSSSLSDEYAIKAHTDLIRHGSRNVSPHIIECINGSSFFHSSSVFLSTMSCEGAYGALLPTLKKRRDLRNLIRGLLPRCGGQHHQNLLFWIENPLLIDSAKALGVESSLKEFSSELVPWIAEDLHDLLVSKTFWIVGGDDWSFDSSLASIQSVLKTEENIKILIIDTCTYSEGSVASRRKIDLGLYAMNYGFSYVASISSLSMYTQALQAFQEASSFDGPALVIAHMPRAINLVESMKIAKIAVDNGQWPLYRWNPRLQESFSLDSSKLRDQIEAFVDRHNQFIRITQDEMSVPDFAKGSVSHLLEQKSRALLESSFNALLSSVGKPLPIFFGSDQGKAEEAAKKLAQEASKRGFSCEVAAMDDIVLSDLALEKNVVFVVCTAGQGEFPENAKDFWKRLKGAAEESFNLSETKFGVFGLGDSKYWPHPGEEKYFCKAGSDLHKLLVRVHGTPLLDCGLGDDQDPDGYNTKFGPWKDDLWKALGVDSIVVDDDDLSKLPADDVIKTESNFLRGTIAEGLADTSTGALSLRDTKLTKFHGIYQQDDRDIREARRKAGKEKDYSFMIRVRVPGGRATSDQFLAMDDLSQRYGRDLLKLTTRQTFQFHFVLKSNLKTTIQGINKVLMDTLAACGDVNRNVMCNINPFQSPVHAEVERFASDLSRHLSPRTSAYHEIWLDKVMVAGDAVQDVEPLYGPTYLPRKFKIAIAIPPSNDVDVYAHCMGFVAIVQDGVLLGYDVLVGGGMGMTHNNDKTYPCIGLPLGFCTPAQAIDVAEKVMLVQRDFGDRKNRKHARLKYTVRDMGLDNFRFEVESRLGYTLGAWQPFQFTSNSDVYGWNEDANGLWHYGTYVQNGRIRDFGDTYLKTALREIAKIHSGGFRLSGNQNISVSNVRPELRGSIEEILMKHGVIGKSRMSRMRLNSMACTALPTCGLAFAESERYLPDLISKIELILEQNGLMDEDITIRMTGCPNGCARPYVAEIAFVGRSPGIYNMYIGGGFWGQRLNKLYRDGVDEKKILEEMEILMKTYSKNRIAGEHFGDFAIRWNLITAVKDGPDFHSCDHKA